MKSIKLVIASIAFTLPVAAFSATTSTPAPAQNVAKPAANAVKAPGQAHSTRKTAKATCGQSVLSQKSGSHAKDKAGQNTCEAK
jgi:uncharacterized low-complexity protein